MPKTVCGLCSETSPWKMAAVYWRWRWPSGDGRGYKQFFDAGCIGHVLTKCSDPDEVSKPCPVCGDQVDNGLAVTPWATVYVPGKEPFKVCVPYHEACFVKDEASYLRNAVRLADREPALGSGGGPPARNPWDSWTAQGIDADG